MAATMSGFRLIFASLRHHWRVQAAVACGVAAATAVVCGALLVGDSMRGSLRRLTLDRLGRVELALATDRFFRAELANELEEVLRSRPDRDSAAVAPAVLLQCSLENADQNAPARANRVNLIGCDERFWQLDPSAPGQAPQDREIVLNEPLAEQLGVRPGEAVLVHLPQRGPIPADTPLGRKAEMVKTQRLTVGRVIPAAGLGRFSLRASQQQPRNAYVPLDWLQERLARTGQVNAILVAGPPRAEEPVLDEARLQAALRPALADYGIRIKKTDRGYFNVTSDHLILEPAAEEAILKAIGRPDVQPALAYLANTIACGRREIPYSIVAAVDFAREPPLGPMLTPERRPIGTPADHEIVLNSWAASDLRAKPGDTIRVEFFEPESTQGAVRKRSCEFRLAAIAELDAAWAGAAADPDFTPEVPGVTDQRTIRNWDLPALIDAGRVRKEDDDYWEAHRGTPKAFVSLAAGRRLWAGRFGRTTSLRVPPAAGLSAGRLQERISLDPAAMGFVLQPVKRQGLEAAVGTTPFEVLFLAFSSFLLVSAGILAALLFRLGVDRRAAEIGILLAVGLRRRQVAGLLAAEGLLVAAAGGLAGVVLGIGYAMLLLLGLQTWWLGAVVTPFLRLHVAPQSLAIGWAGGVAIAFLAILRSARRVGRTPPRQLLAGQTSHENLGLGIRRGHVEPVAWGVLAAALALGLFAARLGEEARAGAFFGAGAMVLLGALVLIWTRLAAGSIGPAVGPGRGNLMRLAIRNAARNPTRSTLTVGLVAAACFLIVAVSGFRLDPAQAVPDLQSGNGGFALVAESDQPVFHDLNAPEGRAEVGFLPEESRALEDATIIPLRVRPGDDASCLNLYQPRQPRVLGVPRQLIDRGGFAWADFRRQPGLPGGEDPAKNPWRLLDLDLGTDPDGVPRAPVVLEKNAANYSLHLWKGVGQTYEIRDDRGRAVRLEIVGLLSGSVLQGDLLIGERAFLRHFPQQTGYRFFLVETKPEQAAAVRKTLERALGGYGLAAETTRERLAAFSAVQNTYLSTFQSLGALGLLLGTFGLAAVEMRSVLERRRELALMRATGFRRRALAWLVGLENALLLGTGLACGILAALVAVLPHLLGGGASIPWAGLAGTFGLVFAVGLAAGLAAVRAVLTLPLLASLRSE